MAEYGTPLPDHVLESIKRNKVALKGPITTPVGEGFRSVNVTLRQALGLYANLRPARSIKGLETRYEDVDLVIVRENTEDLYAGIEHMVGPDAAESIKIITRAASERIARFAFDYAVANGRRKVTAVHKANIMKLSDGLFLESCRTVAADYDGRVEFEDRIVDNMCMQLVQKPELYDVLVLPNLYGDIVSDLAAGLVGGLGVAPGANIGTEAAVFEPVHGSAPKYAGLNKANPTALILSGALMLRHLGYPAEADRVETAVREVIGAGTDDLRPGRFARDVRVRRRDHRAAVRRSVPGQRRPMTGLAGSLRLHASRPARLQRLRCHPPARPLVDGAGRPGNALHDLRDVPVLQRDHLDAAVRHGLSGRRLPVAAVLAAYQAGLAADLDQSRALHPVDPARLPGHLLLLPQGVLPLLFRRSAGLRGRRADDPSRATRWRPPSRSSCRTSIATSCTSRSSRCSSCGSTPGWPSRTGAGPARARWRDPLRERVPADRLLAVVPLAAPPRRRQAGLLLLLASRAGPPLALAAADVAQPAPHGVGVDQPDLGDRADLYIRLWRSASSPTQPSASERPPDLS